MDQAQLVLDDVPGWLFLQGCQTIPHIGTEDEARTFSRASNARDRGQPRWPRSADKGGKGEEGPRAVGSGAEFSAGRIALSKHPDWDSGGLGEEMDRGIDLGN